MSEPKFYTKNYVTQGSSFTSSHGDDFMERICDWDRQSQWVSDGANSDATEVTLEVVFENGDAEIDRVIIVNHNLKDPTIEYWDGDSWETFATGSALATANKIFTNAGVTTDRIRIRCSTTQVTNEEKEIGELIVCAVNIAIAQDLTQLVPSSRVEESQLKTADGSLHRTVFKHTQYRSEKYEATVSFNFVTAAEIETLRQLKENGAAFTFQPESEQRIDEIYYCHWVGPFKPKYMTTSKAAGFTIEMQIKEV